MATKFKLPGGKEVELREINIKDEMAAYRAVGGLESNPLAQQAALALEFIRRSLVSVSGRAVTYNDLDGDGLFAQFTGKEMKFVQAAFARVNACLGSSFIGLPLARQAEASTSCLAWFFGGRKAFRAGRRGRPLCARDFAP